MSDDLELLKHRLQSLLKDNVVEVVFEKVNGEQRRMKCTLMASVIPNRVERYSEESNTKWNRNIPEDVLPVWDLDKNAWRSFRIENVLDFMTVREE